MHLLVAVAKPEGPVLADSLKTALPGAKVSCVSGFEELLGSAQTVAWDAAIITPDSLFGSFRSALRLLRPGITIVVAPPSALVDLQRALEDGADDVVVSEDLTGVVPEIVARLRIRFSARSRDQRVRDRYRQVVETPGHIAYRLDEEGRFTELLGNTDVLGVPASSLIGQHFSQLLDPECARRLSRQSVLPGFQGVSTGTHGAPRLFDERRRGRRRTTGLRITLRSGRGQRPGPEAIVTSAGEIEPQMNGTSAVVGSFGVIHSIRTGDRTSEVPHTFYAVAEEVLAAVLVLDIDLVVEYANPGFYHRFAAQPEAVLGRPVGQLSDLGIDPRIGEETSSCIAAGRRWSGILPPGSDAGHGSRDRVAIRPITDRAGTPRGAVLVFTQVGAAPVVGNAGENDARLTIDDLVSTVRAELERERGCRFSRLDVAVPRHVGQLPVTGSDTVRATVTDLVDAAVGSAESAEARLTVSATGDTARLAARISGGQGTRIGTSTDPGAPAFHAVVEIARAQLSRLGGSVEISRSDTDLEIALWFPAGESSMSIPGRRTDSHYDLSNFLNAYAANRDLSEEIMEIFAEETPDKLGRLKAAVVVADRQDARHLAQSLATTAATLMYDVAAAAARDLEIALRADDDETCRIALGRLEPLIREILTAIQTHRH